MKSFTELETEMSGEGLRRLAILPVGCYEQHGPVLPLDTDNLIADGAALKLARSLEGEFRCHCFPCLPFTTTEPNENFAGTVTVAADPFRAYLREVCKGILSGPFDALVVLNSHGSIVGSLKEVGFGLVMDQFRTRQRPVVPLLVQNVFDFDMEITEKFGQKVGRHADWKEFLLVYGLIGSDYFDETRTDRLKRFARDNDFKDPFPNVLGIPAEFRTTQGVQGQPLPMGEDYERLAVELWDFTVKKLRSAVVSSLLEFWDRYSQAGSKPYCLPGM
jgi:creatinine amidohydrolase/Fe(II)-dependent formamide hydrolase-like protein